MKKLLRIPITLIRLSAQQSRSIKPLDELKKDATRGEPHSIRMIGSLKKLAHTLRPPPVGVGQIHPVIVRWDTADQVYILLAGLRRYLAAQLAELEYIEAIVVDDSETDCLARQLVENLLREDLSDMEVSWTLHSLKSSLEERAGQGVAWSNVEELCQISERQRQRLAALTRLPRRAQQLAAQARLSERVLRHVIAENVRASDEAIIEVVDLLAQGVQPGSGEYHPYTAPETVKLLRGKGLLTDPSPGQEEINVKFLQREWGQSADCIHDVAQSSALGILDPEELDVLRVALQELGKVVKTTEQTIEGLLRVGVCTGDRR